MSTNSKKKNNSGESIIEEKLKRIPLKKLSKESGFCKRKGKINPKEFLIGFFLMVFSAENNSYRNWGIKIGLLIKKTVSKQALQKRMKVNQIIFLQKVLGEIIKDKIKDKINKKIAEKLKQFKRILIEDSTCIELSDQLWKEFPGNCTKRKKKKAVLKIQATYNLLKARFIRFDIMSFRKNDQGYSKEIMEIAKKGDLVVRDLGYFVLEVFSKLKENEISFISRMRKKINIFNGKDDEKPIDLAKMLRKRGQLDMSVFLGEKERLPIRIIALAVEESVAAERKRKAKANRDKRLNPSKESIFLLGWELFITNISEEDLDANDIAGIYFLRWRIETIFKCWKSYFKITNVPKDKNKLRIESFIYCMLIFIVLFQVSLYNYYSEKLSLKKKQIRANGIKEDPISMLKLMQFLAANMNLLLPQKYEIATEDLIIKQIRYYCLYESRNDRKNFCIKIQKLG